LLVDLATLAHAPARAGNRAVASRIFRRQPELLVLLLTRSDLPLLGVLGSDERRSERRGDLRQQWALFWEKLALAGNGPEGRASWRGAGPGTVTISVP
jgi:hypothetical protein